MMIRKYFRPFYKIFRPLYVPLLRSKEEKVLAMIEEKRPDTDSPDNLAWIRWQQREYFNLMSIKPPAELGRTE